MNIIICDDCPADIEHIESLCQMYATEQGLEFDIITVTDPLHLDNSKADLLFLDICMPEKNGIEIQRQLELMSGKPLVIFVTNYPGYSMSSHGANVIGFIEKPARQWILFELLDRARLLLTAERRISWTECCTFNTKQIQYIIMDKGVSKARLSTGEMSTGVFKTIKQWNEELQEYGFLRINQSCLVNFQYIDKMTNGHVVLKSGEILNTSRRERKCCEEKYMQLLERHARFL